MHQKAAQNKASWVTLLCTLVALGCGDVATGPDPNPDPNPNPQLYSVSVESSIGTAIAIAHTAQLAATVTNSDGNVVSGIGLTWQSSDPDVATVNATGFITGVGEGQVTISATYEGSSGSVSLVVVDADLDAIAQLRDDPLVNLLIERLESDLAAQLTSALVDLDGAVTVGNCMAVRDAIASAISSTSAATDPSDVISLAVLGLVLERAHDLLGL